MNLQKRKRLTVLEKKLMAVGGLGGRDSYEAGDGHVHTAVFKMDIQQRPTVYQMCVCAYIYTHTYVYIYCIANIVYFLYIYIFYIQLIYVFVYVCMNS